MIRRNRRRRQTVEHPTRRKDDEENVFDQLRVQIARLDPVLKDMHERLRRGEL